jgi:hypothetical protein
MSPPRSTHGVDDATADDAGEVRAASRTKNVLAWLLDGDPAIVWQTRRDLMNASPSSVARSRARVRREGWGARLLGARDVGGTWGGGLYVPKWTSTFYTLQLLAQLGVTRDQRCHQSCLMLLDLRVQPDGTVRLWSSPKSDPCVAGMLVTTCLGLGVSDARIGLVVDRLLDEQMADGGWNCRGDATHASFHSTVSVLEALGAFLEGHRAPAVARAAAAGREMLLEHRLFRSHRTGRVVSAAFTRFSFPPRWKYDVLRALDHFRAVNAPWDERLADAVALVERRRGVDGRWKLQNRHPGATHFELEAVGAPSRWNTLRASRVLAWVAQGPGGRPRRAT